MYSKIKISDIRYVKSAFPVMIALMCGVLMTTCADPRSGGKNDRKGFSGIHKTYRHGPVTAELEVDQSEIDISQRLILSITVIADEEYDIKLPDIRSKLEPFGIVDYHATQPELLENKREKVVHSYILEPFLSGDYAVPPMKVAYRNKDSQDSAHFLETEEINIKVHSLFPEDVKQFKFNDIRPPVEIPRDLAVWIWSGIGAAGLAAVAVIWFVIFRNHKIKEIEELQEGIVSHELAYRELNRLVSEDLVEKGKIKLFYQRISDILRRYIEHRFGLRAPEETTEEFLFNLEKCDVLADSYQQLLKGFLDHCDLVKFAAHNPSHEEIQKTFESCKDFIDETSSGNWH